MDSHMKVVKISLQKLSLSQFPEIIGLIIEEWWKNFDLISSIIAVGYSNAYISFIFSLFRLKKDRIRSLQDISVSQSLVFKENFRSIF